MATITIDNKIWAVDHINEPIGLRLVKALDRDRWSLRDIHEVSQMINQNPIVKEVVVELLRLLKEA